MISNRHLAALIAAVIPGLVWLGGVAAGQDAGPDRCGFVRLLDAVSAGTGKLDCLIDGQPVRQEGYQLGNVTGGIALKPNAYTVRFRRDGVTAGQTQVNVLANETMILIPYAEWVPATEQEAAHWQMRILRLKQHEADDKRTASFVSVAREAELTVEILQANGKWESILVKRLAIARTAIRQARGYLRVRCNDQPLTSVSVAAAGNFVSVLYNDATGVLRSINFQDYKYLSEQ